MALSTTIDLRVAASLSKDVDLVTGASLSVVGSLAATLTSGTAAGKADLIYHDTRTISSGVTEDIDLAGSLTNGFGEAVVFVKVKLLWLKSAAANTVNFTVFGDAASAPFLNTAATTTTLTPGGVILLYNPTGFAVTGTTADILQIAAGAANSVIDIIVIGTSA